MNAISLGQLTEMLQAYGPALVLFARQHCDCPEDVVQEAFVRLIQQSEAPKNARAWLYKVVRNGAIARRRSDDRRRRREAEAAEQRNGWFTPSVADPLDAHDLREALAGIDLELRETIVARIWGGMSFDEVARLTKTSLSTAHRRYVRGLQILRERLDGSCPETK